MPEPTSEMTGDARGDVLAPLRTRLEGPNTVGNSRTFWVGFLVALVGLLAYPLLMGSYAASRLALFLLYALLGLSLAVVFLELAGVLHRLTRSLLDNARVQYRCGKSPLLKE